MAPVAGSILTMKVRLPHIRPNFTIDIFQFVQVIYRRSLQRDFNRANGRKIFRVKKLKSGGTVAQN